MNTFNVIYALLGVVFNGFIYLNASNVPSNEIWALETLYNATNGQHWIWRYPTSEYGNLWNFSANVIDPCDNWQGVGCAYYPTDASNQTIANITLNYYNLTGTLPDIFSNLSSLTYLALNFNQLLGTVPLSLCSLVNISSINLRNNDILSSIPECIQNMSSLTSLSLHSNYILGTIPAFGSECKLQYLSYSSNYLFGPLPTSLATVTSLLTLYLEFNFISGYVDVLTNMTQLTYVTVSTNLFVGSVPSSIGRLTNLTYLYLDKNLLTGSLPDTFSNIHNLLYFTIYENRIHGVIPYTVGTWNELLYFSADNNFISGTLPQTLLNWRKLQQFIVYNNLLSGSLPVSFSLLPNLNLFLIQENLFTGTPGIAFNSTIQTKLQTIDISSNGFTGTMPVDVFGPSLVSFSSYQVCFSGRFPKEICSSTLLSTLVIDGITAWCSKRIWPGIGGSPKYTHPVHDGIPSCIWTELKNLTMFHASGNGLRGTIPDLLSYANLSDLDLSFNSLTGTIPDNLQKWSLLTNLDLESNKFVGHIADLGHLDYSYSSSVEGVTLTLNTNRLSGIIPVEIEEAEDINILNGNLFTCSAKHLPPTHDPNTDSYVCGSHLVDISLYGFAGVAGVCFIFVCVFVYLMDKILSKQLLGEAGATADGSHNGLWQRLQYYMHIMEDYDKMSSILKVQEAALQQTASSSYAQRVAASLLWVVLWRSKLKSIERSPTFLEDYPHFRQFLISLRTMRSLTVLLTGILIAVGLPMFAALKTYYRTYDVQFRWRLSSVFLSGYEPAVALVLTWMILLTILVGVMSFYIPFSKREVIVNADLDGNIDDDAESASSHHNVLRKMLIGIRNMWLCLLHAYHRASRRSVWISIAALAINMITILAIKGGFVYLLVAYQSGFFEKIIVELMLSLVDIIWSAVLVPVLINSLPNITSTGRMILKVCVLLINSLITSCLAILIADASCFDGVFIKEQSSTENFLYTYCDFYNADGECTQYVSWKSHRQYTPQFFYNYNCYSAVVTEYVPIFLLSYSMMMLAIPLGSWLVVGYRNRKWSFFLLYPEIYWNNAEACAFHTSITKGSIQPINITTESPMQRKCHACDACDEEESKAAHQPNQSSINSSSNSLNPSVHDAARVAKDADSISVDAIHGSQQQSLNASEVNVRRSQLLFPAFILASAFHHLLIILTFGTMYPLLALSLALLACSTTATWEVLLGRWLTMQGTLGTGSQHDIARLNEVCIYVCCSPRKCLWIIAYSSAVFIGMVALDMAGDKQGWRVALWAPTSTFCFAFIVLAYFKHQKAYGGYQPREGVTVVTLEEVKANKEALDTVIGGDCDEVEERSSIMSMMSILNRLQSRDMMGGSNWWQNRPSESKDGTEGLALRTVSTAVYRDSTQQRLDLHRQEAGSTCI